MFLCACSLKRDNKLDLQNYTIARAPKIKFSSAKVYSDDNRDSIVNKGESIQLKVRLKNSGNKTASGVRAYFAINSPYVTILSPTSQVQFSYGYSSSIPIEAESSDPTYPNLSFNVSKTTPPGTVLNIIATITSDSGGHWTDTFKLTVSPTAAKIQFSKTQIAWDDNHNNYVNPGETINLKIILKNSGTSEADGVTGIVSCSSPYVTNLTPTSAISFGSNYSDYISAGSESSTSSFNLAFMVLSSTPTNALLSFPISITDDCGNSWSDTFTITVH